MTTDGYADLERALGALTVPEDLAQRHLARLAAVRDIAGEPNVVVPLRRARRGRARAVVGGTVLGAVLMSGAGVAAASTAVPGDALYGLKSTRERVQLSMTRPGESRARLELRLARTRLAEAAELLRDGDVDRAVATLARADAALASASAQGGGEVDAQVAGELDRRVAVLARLLDGGLPDTAADAAREAVDRALDRGAATPPGKPAGPRVTPTPGSKPSDVPAATPSAKPTVRPGGRPTSRPEPGSHPGGKPTAPPSRGRR